MSSLDAVQNSIDTWNNADRQGFLACYTDDCEISTPTLAGTGHDGVAAFWASIMDAVPDARVTVRRLISEGETVAEEAGVQGTNTGASQGPDGTEYPATGRPMEITFSAFHTVRDGKITASHFYWDALTVLGQLGLLPESVTG